MTTKNVLDITTKIPANHVVGRLNSDGTAQTIHIDDLTQAVQQRGILSAGQGSGNTLAGLSDVSIASPTNGQVLTYNSGTGKWDNAAGGGGGALALISTLTASASASLAWTGLATQTSWKLVGRLLVPATNNTGLGLVVGTGAGPTYVTTGYNFALTLEGSDNATHSFGAENQAVSPCDDGTTANAAPGTSFDLTISTDNATFVAVKGTLTFIAQLSHLRGGAVSCYVPITAAITALKLSFGTGNITSGNASLYSLSH